VFTLTGSQIPSQFKIQILSITGKVVREITKQELGPVRIGRNISEYKWDGKDQYGQLLGNGVYLYRVVTTINGENVERRANNGIDKFNKNGYTKMYIMR
jgi:flagellar hook assembly protein FlgD